MQQDWDKRFLELALHISTWSKDLNTKVGCVITNADNQILTTGYNGLPRILDDSKTDRLKRPEKYLWTEHAERNALYQAARLGISLMNCTLHTTLFPCCDCSRGIIQSGITRVVVFDKAFDPRWKENFMKSWDMLIEAGVGIWEE